MQRIRVFYSKTEGLRYTANLDMHKVWERSLRRAGLPVAYSQGFHPQPRIQQGCPLPLGFLSTAEVVDFWLNTECGELSEFQEALSAAVPSGIQIQRLEEIDQHEQALQARTLSTVYQVVVLEPTTTEELTQRVDKLLSASSIMRIRRDKPYDLRPLIEELTVKPPAAPDESPLLIMQLSAREGATGRPEEVLVELGFDPLAARVLRTAIHFSPVPAKI